MIKTFVINLERRSDRLKELSIPFDYEVHRAVDGLKLSGFGKLSGHIGCLLSHIDLLEKIKERNLDHAVVFEDDVVLCENFPEKMIAAMAELPDDWDLLYLGGWNIGNKKRHSSRLNVAENVLTTHAYVIRNKFIDVALERLKSRQYKVDVLLAEALTSGKCFICDPVLAYQREGFSDILHRETNNTHLK